MAKFNIGDRVKIKSDVLVEVQDNSPTQRGDNLSSDHNHVPCECVGTVLEVDGFPYVMWDDWVKWAVHEDTLEIHIVQVD